jgi:hypothetical protein
VIRKRIAFESPCVHVRPANADDRAQVERLAKAVQAATNDSVEMAFVD